jgi:hypothetical protein
MASWIISDTGGADLAFAGNTLRTPLQAASASSLVAYRPRSLDLPSTVILALYGFPFRLASYLTHLVFFFTPTILMLAPSRSLRSPTPWLAGCGGISRRSADGRGSRETSPSPHCMGIDEAPRVFSSFYTSDRLRPLPEPPAPGRWVTLCPDAPTRPSSAQGYTQAWDSVCTSSFSSLVQAVPPPPPAQSSTLHLSKNPPPVPCHI